MQSFLSSVFRNGLENFGGLNSTLLSMPTSYYSFLHLQCTVLRLFLTENCCPISLCLPFFSQILLSHSIVIPIIHGYYKWFLSVITKRPLLAPQPPGYWCLRYAHYRYALISGNWELKWVSLCTTVYRNAREWALVIAIIHPGCN